MLELVGIVIVIYLGIGNGIRYWYQAVFYVYLYKHMLKSSRRSNSYFFL